MWSKPLTIVETTLFIRGSADVWSDAERADFIDFIARNPEAGDVIQDTGGVRKVRWGRQGSGKRGGVRVIYFYQHRDAPLYLLMFYTKAPRENLSSDEKHALQALAAQLKRIYRGSGARRTS